MDNTEEIIKTIFIGTCLVIFLRNKSRVQQSIKLCKECLVLLNNKGLEKHKKLVELLCTRIYSSLFETYCLLNDHTSVIECGRKLLNFLRGCGDKTQESQVTCKMAQLYYFQSKYKVAKKLYKEALRIMIEIGNKQGQSACYGSLGTVYQSLGEYEKAKTYQENAIVILKEIGDKRGEATCYRNLGTVYQSLGEYEKAKTYQENAIVILKEIGDKRGEATCYWNLGTVYQSLGEYEKAKTYQENALVIRKEIGNKRGEADCYGNLGTVYQSLGEYEKAKTYQENALVIRKEIGDKQGEAACYGNLGAVYHSLGEYEKAETYHKNALVITKKIGNKQGEATCYGNVGKVYQSVGEYEKAKTYHENALVITKEIGDKKGEAACYGNLGTAYQSLSEYEKAKTYQENAIVITKEIGDKQGEAACYGNLGYVCHSLGEYGKAKIYHKNALVITKEIGDKKGEAVCYGNLGTVYNSLGKYEKAKTYQENALVIRKEIADKQGEATCYGNLGVVYDSLGEYGKAGTYHKNALFITKEIGDKNREAECYMNLGIVYKSFGEYGKAKTYQENALVITKEIGDKRGEATCYGNLGTVYEDLGEYGKAEKYQKKALVIQKEIGDKKGEAICYTNLGSLFRSLGKYAEAKAYHERALAVSREIGYVDGEIASHHNLANDLISEGNVSLQDNVFLNLLASITKCEKMRSFLGRNEQFKISLLDKYSPSYQLLSALYCLGVGKEKEALCVLELGRGRALADLLSGQYSAQQQISVNPLSWPEIERIVKKEIDCNCLYISYFGQYMFLWVLKGNKPTLFRKVDVNECFVKKGLERDVQEVFSEKTFGRFNVLGHDEESYEDRSLFFSNVGESKHETSKEGSSAAFRPVETEEEEDLQPVPTLAECYQMIITPVANFLDEPEIVIVPDRALYKVPFAALRDESETYLSQSYRIRIVPSLSTLGLIQDSPADYHSQTGALIVGDPDVGDVLYKGRTQKLCRLPSARKEAVMIAELLGAEPLLEERATKQAVLQRIPSVSLIHFAAHGHAERGEIALAPQRPTNATPCEKDYLLTMDDISQVQLRAKLVVLSCCHSAQGKVRAEGVVGIARAFLGSGARSVLAALWPIPDEATEQLMSRFYKHLVRGKSASESLHQAMKWMRSNGYVDLENWAPFMLIGDNVTFDFGK